MVNALEDIMDVVVHHSHCIEPFFYSVVEQFILVIEVYRVWIEAIESPISREIVHSGKCSIVHNFCKR